MTYAELIDKVIESAFPEGYADNLLALYRKRVLDGLIELQRAVPYLRSRQIKLYPFSSTYYKQGLSLLCRPAGKVRRLATFSSRTLKDIVYYDPCTREDIERLTQHRARVQQYPETASNEFGAYSPSSDLDKGYRAERGLFCIDRDQIIVFPHLESTERVMVEWEGSVTAYDDSDIVDFGKYEAQVLTALENYVRWKSLGKDDRSAGDYVLMEKEWVEAVRGLIIDTQDDTEAEITVSDIGSLSRTLMPAAPDVTFGLGCDYDPSDAFFSNIWMFCEGDGKFYNLSLLILNNTAVPIQGDEAEASAAESTYETITADKLSLKADNGKWYEYGPRTLGGQVVGTTGSVSQSTCNKTLCTNDISCRYLKLKNPDDGLYYIYELQLLDGVPVPTIVDVERECDEGGDSLIPEPTEAPEAPVLSALADSDSINLSWNAVDGAEFYVVRRSTTPGGPYVTLSDNLVATVFDDDSVQVGTTYYYVVVAHGVAGDSDPSNEASATIFQQAPDAPTNLVATADTDSIVLTWDAVAGATSYNVKRAEVSGGPYTTIAVVAEETYDDTSVSPGVEYFYVVSAVNSGGEGDNSNEASAMVQEPQVEVPGAPANLSATADDDSIVLTWDAVAGATSYNVKRAEVSGGPYTTIAVVAEETYDDTSVSPGVEYFYVVSAVNSGGEGDSSNEASAMVQEPQVPALDPDDLGGLLVWLRSDRGVYTEYIDPETPPTPAENGDRVSHWMDASGNDYHFWNPSPCSEERPLMVVNAINGFPALEFLRDPDNYQSVWLGSYPTIPVLMPITVFLVYAHLGTAHGTESIIAAEFAYPLQGMERDEFGERDFIQTTEEPLMSSYHPNTGGQWVYTSAVIGGDNSFLRKNGEVVASGSLSSLLVSHLRLPGFQLFYGRIAEVIVYNRPLTPEEILGVESYLKTRYAL